jgi:hypothetical protein
VIALAVRYSEEALDLYSRYPLTPQRDLAEANTLHVVAKACATKSVEDRSLLDTWRMLKAVPFKELLDDKLLIQFFGLFLPFLRHTEPSAFENTIREIRNWSSVSFAEEVEALVEGRLPALRVLRRLQRAAAGLPPDE